jgi:hypothetical protein
LASSFLSFYFFSFPLLPGYERIILVHYMIMFSF